MNQEAPGFRSKAASAQWGGVSLRTLDRLIARGLPTYRTSPRGKILIRPDDLAAFLVHQPRPDQALDALVNAVLHTMATHTQPAAGMQAAKLRRGRM